MSEYFCHTCEKRVSAQVREDQEPHCEECGLSFVEAVESEEPERKENGSVQSIGGNGWSGTVRIQRFSLGRSLVEGNGENVLPMFEDQKFELSGLLNNILGSVLQSTSVFGLADIQNIHGSLGDYGVGQNFNEILEYLRSLHPDRFGRPPAPEKSIAALPDVVISPQDLLDSKRSSCAICQDSFIEGEVVKLLPCSHCFHSNCITPWLKQCNSCPICRAELSQS